MKTLNVNYHCSSLDELNKLIKEDVDNSKKIIVTTSCQNCGKHWTRETYLAIPPSVLILEVCCM